jgi:hypothetical protein
LRLTGETRPASTSTDSRNLVFCRGARFAATRVRENWFLATFIMGGGWQSGTRPSTGKFCRFLGGFGGGGVGSGSQGRNLRRNGLGYARPGRRGAVAGQGSSVPRALFHFAFKMTLRRAGFWTSGEARARRISVAICNERATKPEVQKTSELVSS